MLDTYLKWFEAHERILIIAMVLALGYFGLNKWLDKSAMDAQMKAAVAQQVAAVQHDADTKIAAAVAQQTALLEQERQQHDAEIAQLVAAVASRDAASSKKVNEVTHSTDINQAVNDLNAAYGNTLPSPLTVAQAGSVPLADLQQFTVAAILEKTAEADLADTQKQLTDKTEELASSTQLVGALQNQVTGLQTELKDVTVADKKALDAAKAEARKGKMKWFKRGFIVGFIGGLITGHAAGI